MNISLPRPMRRFLEAEVRAGTYASTSEAVRDGIRMLQERDRERKARFEGLRRSVVAAIDEADRGGGRPLDVERVVDRIVERGAAARIKRRAR